MNSYYVLISFLGCLAMALAGFVCLVALNRWQRSIWRRERGEPPTDGFPVIHLQARDKIKH